MGMGMQPPGKLPPLSNLIAGVTAAECVALADACCERRDFDRAVEAYRHALTLIPLPLARRRHTIKRLEQANGLYAADVHVGVGNALLGRSQVAQIDGEGDDLVLALQQQAVLEYAEAVGINPRHVQAAYNLGTLLYCLGDAGRERTPNPHRSVIPREISEGLLVVLPRRRGEPCERCDDRALVL